MLSSLVSVKPRTDLCVDKSQSAQKANGVQRYSISLRPHFFFFFPDLMVGLWLWRQRLETHKRMIDCRRFVLFFPTLVRNILIVVNFSMLLRFLFTHVSTLDSSFNTLVHRSNTVFPHFGVNLPRPRDVIVLCCGVQH